MIVNCFGFWMVVLMILLFALIQMLNECCGICSIIRGSAAMVWGVQVHTLKLNFFHQYPYFSNFLHPLILFFCTKYPKLKTITLESQFPSNFSLNFLFSQTEKWKSILFFLAKHHHRPASTPAVSFPPIAGHHASVSRLDLPSLFLFLSVR
jgi:hypothetical protein